MTKLSLRFFLLVTIIVRTFTFANAQCSVTASKDTTVCIFKPTIQLSASASNSGLIGYEWAPVTGLSNSKISNPIANPLTTTSYVVTAVIPDNTELVTNGNFSSGNTGFTSSYTHISNPVPFTNNLLEGQYTIKADPSTTHQCFTNCKDKTSGTGNMMIFNGSKTANVAVWTQTISVTPNTDYAFSAWLQNVTCPPYGFNAELQFSINNTLLGKVFRSDSAVCKWKQFYEVWNSGASTSATISIVNQYTNADGNDFALDDISFRKLCPAKDTVTITIGPKTNNRTLFLCIGDSVFAQGRYRKIGGTYFDTLKTIQNCDSVVTTTVSFGIKTANIDTTICTGDSIFLQKGFRKIAGSYIDSLKTLTGCDSIVTVKLQVQNNFTTTTSTTICSGDSILVNGKYLKNQGVYRDTISKILTCQVISITNLSVIIPVQKDFSALICGKDSFLFGTKYLKTSGIYLDTIYRGTCADTFVRLNLTAKSIPVTNFEFKFCKGDSVFFNGVFIKKDTLISLLIKNPPFCDSSVITTISMVGIAPKLTDSSYYCDDQLAEIDAGAGYSKYNWDNGFTSRILKTNIAGLYRVTITDSNNCIFLDSVRVIERCRPTVYVPTSFTPNNDGLNDFFTISASNISNLKLQIFDRWGEILYETDAVNFTWDGKYKGESLPIGVYHWLASFEGPGIDGRLLKFNQKGMITIVR